VDAALDGIVKISEPFGPFNRLISEAFDWFNAPPSRCQFAGVCMRLESQVRDGVCILRLQGRFVTGSDAALQSAQNSLHEIGIAKAVVDLSGVPYIDSTGLAFIVELHKSLAGRGGQLFLAGANERVREVLEMTRIGQIVPLYEDVEDAEAALHSEVLC
jgi:anti-anti-sigma factor